jgi:hypothetical protein
LSSPSSEKWLISLLSNAYSLFITQFDVKTSSVIDFETRRGEPASLVV